MQYIWVFFFFIFLFLGCEKKQLNSNPELIKYKDQILYLNDFISQVHSKLDNTELKNHSPESLQQIKTLSLKELLQEVLILQYAKDNSIFVKKEDLDLKLSQEKEYFPDLMSFRSLARETQTDYNQWKKNASFEILTQKVIEKLPGYGDWKPLENSEIKKKFQKRTGPYCRLFHIVVDTEDKAKDIQTELKAANLEKFKTFATKYSLSPSKFKGGDLGWLEETSFFYKTCTSSSLNKVTDPKEINDQYHLFFSTKKQKYITHNYEDFKKEYTAQYLAAQESRLLASWLQSQIEAEEVQIAYKLIEDIQFDPKLF